MFKNITLTVILLLVNVNIISCDDNNRNGKVATLKELQDIISKSEKLVESACNVRVKTNTFDYIALSIKDSLRLLCRFFNKT